MRRYHLSFRLLACLSLAALADAKAMACCWKISGQAPEKIAAVSPAHACCHKTTAPIPGAAYSIYHSGKACGGETLASGLASNGFDAAQFSGIGNAIPVFAPLGIDHPRIVPIADSPPGSGPPLFLVLRRLLI